MATAKKAARNLKTGAAVDAASDAVDAQLERYRSMRNFAVTAEPSGSAKSKISHSSISPSSRGLPFCVQKHAASHLHYDFRLGWNGVLKSWAVAKGPSYVVADKRLAVQTEDHPMEYGGFEGIIPKGQYGGGTVMVWDQGTWEPQAAYPDVEAGLNSGSLKFLLHGTKLRGKWALIRMGGKAANERKPNWLLIKEHDEFERRPEDPAVTEAEPDSAVTGRTIEQIAHSEDHVWHSKETARGNAWYRQESKASVAAIDFSARIEGLPKEPQPGFIKPQLAIEAERAPEGKGWLHELKLDGYRMQARKDGDDVRILTRTGLDWTARFKPVADAVRTLPVRRVTLDGEVAVVSEDGTTSFAKLQAALNEKAGHALTYFCFDLLHFDGHSTRGLPLVERKTLLSEVVANSDMSTLRLSDHIAGNGQEVFCKACALQAEGIISKRAESKYSSTRNGDWLKLKCLHEQEFVIGGYTLPSNGIRGVGALLLGYFENGKLIYAGRTGTGFTARTHRMVRDKLETLTVSKMPFSSVTTQAKRGAQWVSPELVAQVRFANWTADMQLRQAAFLGLREDKEASEVMREETAPSPKRARAGVVKRIAAAGEPAKSDVAREKAPIRLTHPEKVLDAESGMTKQMLADYYWAVSEEMLLHVADRPLSLVRCPNGCGKPCFFQKHVTGTLPKGVGSVMVADKKTGAPEPYITLDSREALAGLAQMGVLEVHPWGSKNSDLEHPDRIVFDLDPDEALRWQAVTEAAFDVRERLKRLGLESFVKTTGGKGLHVVLPIEPDHDWNVIKSFTHKFVLEMEKAAPSRYLSKMTKAARAGKIYLDYLRNERGATSVAAYSPRARPGGAVSVPLAWSELKSEERPRFRVAGFAQWRDRLKKNPWKGMADLKQRLSMDTQR